jgi:hypothetical protein
MPDFLTPFERMLIEAFLVGLRSLQMVPFASNQCFQLLTTIDDEFVTDYELQPQQNNSIVFTFFPSFMSSFYHHQDGTRVELLQDMDALFGLLSRATQHALFVLRQYLFMGLEIPHYVSFVERYDKCKHDLRIVERACRMLVSYEAMI